METKFFGERASEQITLLSCPSSIPISFVNNAVRVSQLARFSSFLSHGRPGKRQRWPDVLFPSPQLARLPEINSGFVRRLNRLAGGCRNAVSERRLSDLAVRERAIAQEEEEEEKQRIMDRHYIYGMICRRTRVS